MRNTLRKWTREERTTLTEMRMKGATWAEIGAALGRSKDSCCSYHRDRCDRLGIAKTPRGQRAPVQREEPMPDYTDACEALRVNMIEAFHRFAEMNRISFGEARALLMGGERQFPPVPGTETFLKTSAMRRLAA